MSEPLKLIIEALLMTSHDSLTIDKIQQCFQGDETPDKQQILKALDALSLDYKSRSIELKQTAGGYRFQTKAQFAPWIHQLWQEKPAKYSRATLETLAIIAYRQPVTRADIEEIRGVAVSSAIMKSLLEREWIKIVGHRDVPGKPGIYATTKAFLDYFNLRSLEELPSLLEIKSLTAVEKQQKSSVPIDSDELAKKTVAPVAIAPSTETEIEEAL